MYYEHFGLNYPPFKITPDTQLFYPGGHRGLVLEALKYAIENGEGIIKVVGEVGSGKTMLCRMLEEKLPKHVEIVYLVNPRLSPDMILHAIAFELRLPITLQTGRLEVMHTLQNCLLEKHTNNQQTVVFVEEAQEMPLETLEEIRLLSNLETTRHKLLQIVLFGQPELDINLSVAHIRQLKERITHSFYLPPLSRKDIQEYIDFRMRAVGYRGPSVFCTSAIHVLNRVSNGLVRRINILADKALLAAFAENVHYVTAKHVRLAARDSGLSYQMLSFRTYIIIAVTSMALLWLIIGVSKQMQWSQTERLITSTVPALPSVSPRITALPTVTTTDILLRERLQATREWLDKADSQRYSIQVMQTSEDKTEDLQRFLRKVEIQPLLNQLYVCRLDFKTQIYWIVVYAEFIDAASAIAAITRLPESLQRNQPFIRKIESLRIKQT